MKKRRKNWNEYEKELFSKSRISEDEIMIEKMKMDFAKLLYDCRTSRHMTQKEVAAKLHVQQQYIAKIESGQENLSLETIGKILLALKSVLHVDVHRKSKLTELFEYSLA